MMTVGVQIDGVGEVVSELKEDPQSPGSYIVSMVEWDGDGGARSVAGGRAGFEERRLVKLAGSIAKHSVVRLK